MVPVQLYVLYYRYVLLVLASSSSYSHSTRKRVRGYTTLTAGYTFWVYNVWSRLYWECTSAYAEDIVCDYQRWILCRKGLCFLYCIWNSTLQVYCTEWQVQCLQGLKWQLLLCQFYATTLIIRYICRYRGSNGCTDWVQICTSSSLRFLYSTQVGT